MKNKKGFTLVELLAVIVILGVLLLIAVPSISNLINNSKKNAYADNAIIFTDVAKNLQVLSDKQNGVYVYRIKDLEVSNSEDSPFAKYVWAYVIAECQTKQCKYYYMSLDESGNVIATYTKHKENIMPVSVSLIQSNNGQIVIKLPNEYINANSIIDISDETEKTKLTLLYNQLYTSYNDEKQNFSFALGTSENYTVYTTTKYNDKVFYTKTNENPLTFAGVINTSINYPDSSGDYKVCKSRTVEGYYADECIPTEFVVLEDRGDTILVVEQSSFLADHIKSTSDKTKNLPLTRLIEKMAQLKYYNRDKVLDVRLLETDDLNLLIPSINQYIDGTENGQGLIPSSIISRLNLNNSSYLPFTIGYSMIMNNKFIYEDNAASKTLLIDSKKMKSVVPQTVEFDIMENGTSKKATTTLRYPDTLNDAKIIASLSEDYHIVKTISTYDFYSIRFVFELKKETIINEQ